MGGFVSRVGRPKAVDQSISRASSNESTSTVGPNPPEVQKILHEPDSSFEANPSPSKPDAARAPIAAPGAPPVRKLGPDLSFSVISRFNFLDESLSDSVPPPAPPQGAGAPPGNPPTIAASPSASPAKPPQPNPSSPPHNNAAAASTFDGLCAEYTSSIFPSAGAGAAPAADGAAGAAAGPPALDAAAEEQGAYEEATEEVPLESLSSLDKDEIRQIGNIQRWQRGTLVGSGSYGKVYLAMNLDTAELFVVKQVTFIAKDKAEEVVQLEQEIALLAHLGHVNIVKYLGTELSAATNTLSIFLEYMPGGSIADLVRKFGPLDQRVIRKYTREALEGLGYLHHKCIIHRDIKGQNILVDNSGVCKLADFGASRYLQSADSEANLSFKGTPVFMSPEVIIEQRYSKKSDVWSVGCTIIQMATGNPPFSEFSNHIAALFHITSSADPPPIPDMLTGPARDFVSACFRRQASQRPFVHELLEHPFLRPDRKPDPSNEQAPRPAAEEAAQPEPPPAPPPEEEQLVKPAAADSLVPEDDEQLYRKTRMERLQRKVPIRLKRDLSRRSYVGTSLVPGGGGDVMHSVPTRAASELNLLPHTNLSSFPSLDL